MKYTHNKKFTKSILTSSILAMTGAMIAIPQALARDVFFNTQLVSHFNPIPGHKIYADVNGEGNIAVLGTHGGEGAFIIDLTDPAFPVLAAHYNPTQTNFKDVKINNGIGHFANDEARLGVDLVNLSNPYAPVLMSKITDANNGFNHVHNTFTDGDLMYEVDGNDINIVKVFNIADPLNPVFVRDIPTSIEGKRPHDITVVNNRLYVSSFGRYPSFDSWGRTDIIDVTNAGDPINFASLPSIADFNSGEGSHNSWATDDGNTLIVSREQTSTDFQFPEEGRLHVYDISQAQGTTSLAPIAVIDHALLGIDTVMPHNVVISGDRAFVSWYQAGLQVLDISNPAVPEHVGAYDTFPGNCDGSGKTCADYAGAWGVSPLADGNVLVSDTHTGLYIIDASHAATACNGDFDSDGDVDLLDQAVVTAELGRTDCSKRNACLADFDGDKDVDSTDVAVFDADYLRTDCPIVITNEQPVVTVTSPLPATAALQQVGLNATINFVASASDAEDGDMTNSIVWESNLDGIIGNGGNVSAVLSTGMHTVRASVTDSDSAHGADFAVIIVSDQPAQVEIIMAATGYTKKGKTKSHVVDLNWSGTTAEFVDVYRDGTLLIASPIANSGFYSDDNGFTGSASYDYQVCEAGTTTCSNSTQVVF